MRRALARLGVVAVFFAILACGYAGWRWVHAPDDELCFACGRPVHAHSRTVAYFQGRRTVFCCPTCAMWQYHQAGKTVHVSELTDYVTGARLRPEAAFLVQGSDVNPCLHSHGLMDADKQTAEIHFDRCVPGLLAFATRDEAAQFASGHGGRLLPFSQLAPQYGR
jgi:hypothetical protein